jgi:hypothetical protein
MSRSGIRRAMVVRAILLCPPRFRPLFFGQVLWISPPCPVGNYRESVLVVRGQSVDRAGTTCPRADRPRCEPPDSSTRRHTLCDGLYFSQTIDAKAFFSAIHRNGAPLSTTTIFIYKEISQKQISRGASEDEAAPGEPIHPADAVSAGFAVCGPATHGCLTCSA